MMRPKTFTLSLVSVVCILTSLTGCGYSDPDIDDKMPSPPPAKDIECPSGQVYSYTTRTCIDANDVP